MSFESGLISFAAFASLALAARKPRSDGALPALPSPPAARLLGWGLLALAAVVAMVQLGPGFGLTAWIGQMSVAAALLVLLLSWRPGLIPILAGGALVCAPLLAAI